MDDMAGGFVNPLHASGFDVLYKRNAPEIEWATDDVTILRWARAHRFIYWGFDKHKNGSDTGKRMNDEIHRRNGRLIQMSGGPDQLVSRAIGRMLVHQEHWEPFFADGHGKVRIMGGADHQIRMWRPRELPLIVPVRGVRQGAEYLRKRDAWHLAGRQTPSTGLGGAS